MTETILLTILTLMGDWDIKNKENPKKFQSLFIHPRNINATNSERALNIDNQETKKMEQIKLLGVYINENLSLADHISNLCTRARRNVGVPVHVWNLIPCNAKLTLYVIFASHPKVGRLCGYRRVYYEQYINHRWKHTKNSLLVLSYQPYTTDIYKILPLWCIRLKTILFQAAYHDYSKLRTRNTTWCWATDSIQQTSTRYWHSDV